MLTAAAAVAAAAENCLELLRGSWLDYFYLNFHADFS